MGGKQRKVRQYPRAWKEGKMLGGRRWKGGGGWQGGGGGVVFSMHSQAAPSA